MNGHAGVIGGKATHQCTKQEKETPPDAARLLIDLGCDSREEAGKIAAPGDVAVFDSGYEKLGGGLFSARALDDRGGLRPVAVPGRGDARVRHHAGLHRPGGGGPAGGRSGSLWPSSRNSAVVVDATTAADTAGVPAERQVCRQGKGAVLSFMDKRTLYDRPLYEYITALAEKENLPVQPKTVVAGGNDAGAIQLTGAGCRVAAISLPCRYIHSPACALRKEDLRDTLALLRLLRDRLPAGRGVRCKSACDREDGAYDTDSYSGKL